MHFPRAPVSFMFTDWKVYISVDGIRTYNWSGSEPMLFIFVGAEKSIHIRFPNRWP